MQKCPTWWLHNWIYETLELCLVNCTLDMGELDGTGIKQGRQCVRETALYQTHSSLAVFFGFILIFQQINATFPFFPSSTFRIHFSFLSLLLVLTFEFHMLANNIFWCFCWFCLFSHRIHLENLFPLCTHCYENYFTYLDTQFEESSPLKFLFQY